MILRNIVLWHTESWLAEGKGGRRLDGDGKKLKDQRNHLASFHSGSPFLLPSHLLFGRGRRPSIFLKKKKGEAPPLPSPLYSPSGEQDPLHRFFWSKKQRGKVLFLNFKKPLLQKGRKDPSFSLAKRPHECSCCCWERISVLRMSSCVCASVPAYL